MNEQLKFSWGHIIAFLALIFISYISFVGVTYMTDGSFATAGIAMVVIDVVLATFFLGAQFMKAIDKKFSRNIWVERIFVFGSPIIFIICIIPYLHFWTVNSRNEEIVNNFTNSISASKQMFDDYEIYANSRVENYGKMLDKVIANGGGDFSGCGFTSGKQRIQKDNMVKTLRLQLLSDNYTNLKKSAIDWIDGSCGGASTFNVFLLGNTKEIKEAIHEWNDSLVAFASKKLTNEEFKGYNKVVDLKDQGASLAVVDEGLGSLTAIFTDTHFPNVIGIITALILYFALLFPYLLQDRNTKSLYKLVGMKDNSRQGTISMTSSEPSGRKKETKPSGGMEEISVDSYDEDKSSAKRQAEQEEADDFGSFTL